MRLRLRTIEGEAPTEALFERLFADEENAFWLDSADAPTRLAQCSYMGTSAGRDRCLLSYDVDAGEVAIQHARRRAPVEHGSIFDLLDREIAEHAVEPPSGVGRGPDRRLRRLPRLRAQGRLRLAPTCTAPTCPTRLMMLANRVVAVDHVRRRTHVFAVGRERRRPRPSAWLDEATADRSPRRSPTRRRAAADRRPRGPGDRTSASAAAAAARSTSPTSTARQAELAAGESYEVCLTDQISTDASPDPFALYRHLRRSNPAPFAAFLKLRRARDRQLLAGALPLGRPRAPGRGAADQGDDLARRRSGRGRRPPRPSWPSDEKTCAEHLMIVDLLRNDLGRVCDVDSVSVPELMVVEPYATVHQLVSTITGQLEAERSAGRVRPRLLPRRLDDRGAEAADDGDHRRASRTRRAASTRARSATSASTAAPTSASSSARS